MLIHGALQTLRPVLLLACKTSPMPWVHIWNTSAICLWCHEAGEGKALSSSRVHLPRWSQAGISTHSCWNEAPQLPSFTTATGANVSGQQSTEPTVYYTAKTRKERGHGSCAGKYLRYRCNSWECAEQMKCKVHTEWIRLAKLDLRSVEKASSKVLSPIKM